MIEHFDKTKRVTGKKKKEFRSFFKEIILSTDISINQNIYSEDFDLYL